MSDAIMDKHGKALLAIICNPKIQSVATGARALVLPQPAAAASLKRKVAQVDEEGDMDKKKAKEEVIEKEEDEDEDEGSTESLEDVEGAIRLHAETVLASQRPSTLMPASLPPPPPPPVLSPTPRRPPAAAGDVALRDFVLQRVVDFLECVPEGLERSDLAANFPLLNIDNVLIELTRDKRIYADENGRLYVK